MVQSYSTAFSAHSLAKGIEKGDNYTVVVIGAKPDEGWKFSKWTKNGEDFSSDEQFTYSVTENVEFRAVFEPVE